VDYNVLVGGSEGGLARWCALSPLGAECQWCWGGDLLEAHSCACL
jgi:hypothetical protein